MEALTWDEAPLSEKRRRIFREQDGACLCGVRDWLGKALTLELHHIDGYEANEKRENLSLLCPNCHSQTPDYRNKRPVAEQANATDLKSVI